MNGEELWTQIERNHPESYGWALACCRRDPVEAENVLQTVYLKILEKKAVFDGKAAFKTWLFSVIRKTAADERRRMILRALRLIPFEHSSSHALIESPHEAFYRSEIQSLFCQALTRLSRRQAEVLQLVFYHDLTLADAAVVMGVSIGSARVHYDRGKKQLRQWMEVAKIK